MSEITNPARPGPSHAFTVISQTFTDDTRVSYQQTGSGQLTAAEAHAWIDVQLEAIAALGIREIPAASEQLAADLADQAQAAGAPAVRAAGIAPDLADQAAPLLQPGA